jgi:hypothetical protein
MKQRTAKFKAEVAEYYRSHTVRETAEKFHVGISTVSKYGKAAGVDKLSEMSEQTRAATEACVLSAKEHRAKARENLAKATHNLSKEVAACSGLPPKELWQLATTIDVLTKVIRLEEGESTGRQEVSHEYPDIAALSDEELAAAILEEADSITRGEASTS